MICKLGGRRLPVNGTAIEFLALPLSFHVFESEVFSIYAKFRIPIARTLTSSDKSKNFAASASGKGRDFFIK